MHPSFAIQISLLGLAAAKQACDFNVTAETAVKYGCGDECQRALQTAIPMDLEEMGRDFDFDFYETAANFSGSKPGDVLKFQPLDPETLSIKAGTSVYRIQYTSVDYDGELVPVTGFIAFPYAAVHSFETDSVTQNASSDYSRAAKFPLAAYAHGTSGVYRGCAPSNGPGLYDYDTWQLLIQRGYAVVATDYGGLGNNHTTHKYCSFTVQANDVYYSVLAARKLFGSVLSHEWIGVGHSEGGGAVWKLAESDFVNGPDGQPLNGYLGTVGLAPATRVVDMLIENIDDLKFLGYVPFLGLAVQRATPGLDLSFFTEKLRKREALADEAQLCLAGMVAATIDLNVDEIFSPEGLKKDISKFREWQSHNAPASGARASAPIIVLQGLNDTSVLPPTTRNAYHAACKAGASVHLSQYPGLEHDAVVVASSPEWLDWMDKRFSHHQDLTKCSEVTIQPFDAAHMRIM